MSNAIMDTPTGRNSTLRAVIEALDVGESYTLSRRVELAQPEPVLLQGVTDNLRSIFANPVTKAKHITKQDYVVETGTIVTRSGNLIVCAICTRTA